MTKSDNLIQNLKDKLSKLALIDIVNEDGKVEFLRELLIILNKFFFEYRNKSEVEDLESVYYKGQDTLPSWKRYTEFLAIWDDYAEKILSFVHPEDRIEALAKIVNEIFKDAALSRSIPKIILPDVSSDNFGTLTGREFIFIRIIHALQDFTQLLPAIDVTFANKLKREFKRIPSPAELKDPEQALRFLTVLGGADRNVDERVRYITDVSIALIDKFSGDAYLIFDKCNGDAISIFSVLTSFTGIASKKANMLLRDFYECGLWIYKTNLESINIIADNRIMRVALRTGIVNFALPKLLNDLLDQYDYQYFMAVKCTEDAFRKVWIKCRDLNKGVDIVTFPARLDSFFFHLANANTRQGKKGCCCPTDISCKSGKIRTDFYKWLKGNLNYECKLACPLINVCPDELKKLNLPAGVDITIKI